MGATWEFMDIKDAWYHINMVLEDLVEDMGCPDDESNYMSDVLPCAKCVMHSASHNGKLPNGIDMRSCWMKYYARMIDEKNEGALE